VSFYNLSFTNYHKKSLDENKKTHGNIIKIVYYYLELSKTLENGKNK
jgi:hypothetical protein